MISAQQARASYDKNKLLAEKFIANEIEPKIKTAMEDKKFIEIVGGNYWHQGDSFKFSEEYDTKYEVNIDLTNRVIAILKEHGYSVNSNVTKSGCHLRDGICIYTISWGGERYERG